jgi:hypothetical protein
MGQLALGAPDREARDRHPLASPGLSAVLAMEIEKARSRPTKDRPRDQRPHTLDVTQ